MSNSVFVKKYGHGADAHTRLMAQETRRINKEREEHEARMVRAGRVDPKGMTYTEGQMK